MSSDEDVDDVLNPTDDGAVQDTQFDPAAGEQTTPNALDPADVANATSQLMEQLKSIQEEMAKVKGELYSGEGGLGGIQAELAKLQQQAAAAGQMAGASPASSSGVRRRGVGAATAGRAKASAAASRGKQRPMTSVGDDTYEYPEGYDEDVARMLRAKDEPAFSWNVFIIVFLILTVIGPLRPFLIETIKGFFSGGDYDDYN